MSMDYRRMMQENLDGELDTQSEESLIEHLQEDYEAARENARLQEVHDVLGKAPHHRAPSRLAATIMARLAQQIEAQVNTQLLPAETRLALMLSLSIVQMVMMPVMMAASYLVVNLGYQPEVLTRVMTRTIALLVMMIDGLIVILEEIEEMIKRDPSMTPVAVSLLPVALLGMIDYIQQEMETMPDGAAQPQA